VGKARPDGGNSERFVLSPLFEFPETDCLQTLIDRYTSWQDTTLHNLIDDLISAEANIQQVTNSASNGTVSTGGLGKPKLNIN
jgi:hypothetical protein